MEIEPKSESGVEYALGIDVGYSERRRSTGLCLLKICRGVLSWECLNTGTNECDRLKDLRDLVPKGTHLLGVGIDGPITPSLRVVPHYRTADALLSRGPFRFRGKPGQTSTPSGQMLHYHATLLAKLVLGLQEQEHLSLAKATHPNPVGDRRILEIFPNAFLGVLLPDRAFSGLRLYRDASDRFWEIAIRKRYLNNLIDTMAPQVTLCSPLNTVVDHDHRAALICALAVLCVARNRYIAIGDPVDGDIILPPDECWGEGQDGEPWAEAALRHNLEPVRRNQGNFPNHEKARLLRNGAAWHRRTT